MPRVMVFPVPNFFRAQESRKAMTKISANWPMVMTAVTDFWLTPTAADVRKGDVRT
jgi:hypothetical protein